MTTLEGNGTGKAVTTGVLSPAEIMELGQVVYQKPDALTENITNYCPGCTHGIIHRLIAEAIDELGLAERTIMVAPVGCSVLLYNYFNVDAVEAAHGRAPAMATGLKRTQPDKIVSPTRATATWPPSARRRSCTRPTGARTSRSSS